VLSFEFRVSSFDCILIRIVRKKEAPQFNDDCGARFLFNSELGTRNSVLLFLAHHNNLVINLLHALDCT
jgi:hypothetical protein